MNNPPLVCEHFDRCFEDAITLEEFKKMLASGKQLRIKYGVDVTAPDLHIGHAVNLWMMRELQDLGHKVVFLVGDFTTRIGDPTGKNKTRPVIERSEIEANAIKFLEQVKKILKTDADVFEVRYNSEWFDKMGTAEFMGLLSMVTHSRLIQRDMFQKRIEENEAIYLHEMLYPILQGYDSVMLKSDLTIVGSDQLFNENMGRFFQEKFDQKPQVVLTSRITMGTDGKNKQSKSLGNYIAIDDTPKNKFGKIMSIPDDLIADYLEVYTKLSNDEIKKLKAQIPEDPRGVKLRLAEEVVALYHGAEAGKSERQQFIDTFSKGNIPEEMPEIKVKQPCKVIDMLQACALGFSNTQFRRLIDGGSIKLNGEPLKDLYGDLVLSDQDNVLKVGKRNWFRVVVK